MAHDPNEIVEVRRGQLDTLNAAYGVLNGLYTNKKTALPFKRLLKENDPEGKLVKTADLDLADEIIAPVAKDIAALREENKTLSERISKKEKDDADRDALNDIHAKINAVAKKRGLTEEGKAGLIKTMQDRQIADPDAAALLYLDGLPKSKPMSATNNNPHLPSRLNLFDGGTDKGKGDPTLEAFFKNPDAAFDETVAGILNGEEEAAAA